MTAFTFGSRTDLAPKRNVAPDAYEALCDGLKNAEGVLA